MTIKVTKILTVGNHTLAITKNGNVCATGDNQHGQLGLGNIKTQKTFVEIPSLKNKDIIEITSGYEHTIAMPKNKKLLYIAGMSEFGQLGGYLNKLNKFFEISVGSLRKVIAGGNHTFIIAKNGNVCAAGDNSHGQLGCGNIKHQGKFTEVSSLKDKSITEIFTGGFSTFAITNNGKILATGCNSEGQLGIENVANQKEFIEVSSLKNKGITKIIAGFQHTLAIASNWKVYAAGKNERGQLGLEDIKKYKIFTEIVPLRNKSIKEIALGYDHTFVVSSDYKVYAAGSNSHGKLGLGRYMNNEQKQFIEVLSLKDKGITKIVTGNDHVFAIAKNEDVYAAGDNFDGQLGLGDVQNRYVFTLIPNIKFIFEDSTREFKDNLNNNTSYYDICVKYHQN